MTGKIDLTVVTATRLRHKHLHRTLHQFARARAATPGLSCEHVVVSDGPDPCAADLCRAWRARYCEGAPRGAWGAACKDLGVDQAGGGYVAFWDDDNDYTDNALDDLWLAAAGHDIGVVRCVRWFGSERTLTPARWDGAFVYGDIDTMCVCVRTELARREQWYHEAEADERGTDFRWLRRLAAHRPLVQFRPAVIGYHL